MSALRDAAAGSGLVLAHSNGGEEHSVEVSGAAGPVATMGVSASSGRLRAVVATDRSRLCSSDDAALIVGVVRRAGRLAGCAEVELVTTSLLVRYHARQTGFEGGLRQPLCGPTAEDSRAAGPHRLDPGSSLATGDNSDRATRPTEAEIRRCHANRQIAVAAALNDLVPDVRLEPAAPPGAVRRLVHRYATGFEARLTFRASFNLVPLAFRVTFPDTPDLMVEPVAAALDTTIAIARVTGRHLRGLREIAMRHDLGMRQGRVAGLAESSAGQITLNGSYTSVAHYSELLRRRRSTPSKRPPAPAPPPYLDVDRVVAHELWHVLEAGWQATDYRASMELLRRMGEHYGVLTLQQITRPDLDGAGPPLEGPYRQLIADVSPYATTNVREATAELFAKWWCAEIPESPAISHFGSQLHALLGITRS